MMRRVIAIGLSMFMALVFFSLDSDAFQLAIRRAGSQGWGLATQYGQMFNPQTVETIQGEVISVEKFIPLRRMGFGYLVVVKTKDEQIRVHLGPGYYVDQEGFELAPGDSVQVRGSRILFNGEPTIIASEVTKGDQTLRIRTDEGVPVWSGYYEQYQEG
jgi:hypothetical protein